MTSREIAEYTDKRHGNVMADIHNMLNQLGKDALGFQHIYLDAMNRERIEYRLPKDLTLTLISGYSVPMRHKIVTRWQELEKMPSVLKACPRMPMAAPSTNTALTTRNYNGLTFTFRADGFFNMTKAAQHFGKTLEHFNRSPTTLEYIDAFKSANYTGLVETKRGNGGGHLGTPQAGRVLCPLAGRALRCVV